VAADALRLTVVPSSSRRIRPTHPRTVQQARGHPDPTLSRPRPG
jgi:hypothetical protein